MASSRLFMKSHPVVHGVRTNKVFSLKPHAALQCKCVIGTCHKQKGHVVICPLRRTLHQALKCTAGGGAGGEEGRLEGDKQRRQALVGQSRALLIVSELIESHNEMSGAGVLVGCRPAAKGLPCMKTLLILDLLLNPGRIYSAHAKKKQSV